MQKRFHDPLIDLQRQMNRLVYGANCTKARDRTDRRTGEWIFPKNRYETGNRAYQMQVDFMYLMKAIKDSGRHPSDIKKTQSFIDDCAMELRNAT